MLSISSRILSRNGLLPFSLRSLATASKSMTVREALNQALDEEIQHDENVIVLGEEVGRSEGNYSVTAGLNKKYGDRRVLDTPIEEIGFTGMAVGMSFEGLRPVCEFMTWNFALQSIDHIINSAAKTFYMSGGQINSPIVFRGPNGAAEGFAAQHTQDFSAWFASVPGLKVLSPYDSEDAKGLLKAAIRDDNPVVFLENELLYETAFPVSDAALKNDFVLPIGKAKVQVEGSDITIVSYSLGMKYSMQAQAELKKEGINAEVINLRSLRPFDFETIAKSVQKTGRLVTVETGWPFCGIGSEIAAQVFECPETYKSLKSPVLRVTGVDVPTPYADMIEHASFPTSKNVVDTVRRSMKC
jgi:pyruvate dehydrogenase E1 component beta subunit|uniref:Pyruvate dehydrogenase E1 component subunit beta n=1 Tax=Panagrolaimus sp. PS1159 TaxID=55785 RepID=A0AC35F6B1_9BILA